MSSVGLSWISLMGALVFSPGEYGGLYLVLMRSLQCHVRQQFRSLTAQEAPPF